MVSPKEGQATVYEGLWRFRKGWGKGAGVSGGFRRRKVGSCSIVHDIGQHDEETSNMKRIINIILAHDLG
jgi:hypothetical protein